MNVLQNYRMISITEIIDTDTWNIHPFLEGKASGALQQSIFKTGIFHPPTLIKTHSKGYQVVCGNQRLRCLEIDRESNAQLICRILPSSTPSEQILQLLLEDQKHSGPLTIPEQARFIQLCLKSMDEQEIRDTFLIEMDLTKNVSTIPHLLKFLDFSPEIQRSIHFGLISDKLVHDLFRFSKQDQLALTQLFQSLQIGGGKQKRLLSLLRDHTLSTGKTICSLLEEEDIYTLLNHQAMNQPQKGNQLLALMQKRNFPLRTEAEERFSKDVQSLRLPQSCQLTHSPAFEKDEVFLTIRFKDIQACKDFLPAIKREHHQKR